MGEGRETPNFGAITDTKHTDLPQTELGVVAEAILELEFSTSQYNWRELRIQIRADLASFLAPGNSNCERP